MDRALAYAHEQAGAHSAVPGIENRATDNLALRRAGRLGQRMQATEILAAAGGGAPVAQMAPAATERGPTATDGGAGEPTGDASAGGAYPEGDAPSESPGAHPDDPPPDPAKAERGGVHGSDGAAAATNADAASPSVEPGASASGSDALHMPAPPEALSEGDRADLEAVDADMHGVGRVASELPPGEASARDARGAVTEPTEETAGRAEVALTQALDDRPAPSAEILELCERIRQAIRDRRPPDEDSLVDADPEAMAKAAGAELQTDVEGDLERVQGEYDGMDDAPAGEPSHTPTDYETPDPALAADSGDATRAAPEPIPDEDFSLDDDVDEQARAIRDAGMETEPAQLVEDGPIGAARDAQDELDAAAAETPVELAARQAEAIHGAQSDMATLQAQALAALQSSRAQTVGGTGARQGQMVGTEEQMRAQAGQRMRQIFTDARTQVTALLDPLATNAMARWDAGVAQYASTFKTSLAEVDRIIEDRHAGIGGFFVSVGDAVFGLPDEIVALYDRAEKRFGDDVCALITDISQEVNGIIAACEAIIANAREQIDAVVDSLPEELQTWAQGEAAAVDAELDALQSEVEQTRDDFTRDLCDRAAGAVDDVRREVHDRREAAKGIIGRIADAIAEFLEDPFRTIVNGLLSLAGIDPGAFWGLVDRLGDVVQAIADDPIGFCQTLIGAVGDGFGRFFDNIVTHLGAGFFEWIVGGLSTVGVQMPPDFSLGSIVTLCLQVMGLTWDRVRGILATHIGEENVELLDEAAGFIATFVQRGPAGLFEMLKEHFDPSQLIGMVKDAAMQWLVQKVIQKAVVKLASMLNPAGAIVQAVIAIYDAVTWLFENAAKIFRVVETIVNGAADLIAGNTAALAGAVEFALAGMIAPAIDFVAELVGLGDLPDKIAGIIGDLQSWVLGVVDTAIAWVVKHVRGLLQRMNGDGESGGEDESPTSDDGEMTPDHQATLDGALADASALLAEDTHSVEDVRHALPAIKERHGLENLTLVSRGGADYVVEAEINPKKRSDGELLFTDAQIAEMKRVAQHIADELRSNTDKKERYDRDPTGYLADGQRVQTGDYVEAAAAPEIEAHAAEHDLRCLRNVRLEVDTPTRRIHCMQGEMDFVLLGPEKVVTIVSAKMSPKRIRPRSERATLNLYLEIPPSPPELTDYLMGDTQPLGRNKAYAEATGITVAFAENGRPGSVPLARFRSQYLSSTVVDEVEVEGAAPNVPAYRRLRFMLKVTEQELVDEMHELVSELVG